MNLKEWDGAEFNYLMNICKKKREDNYYEANTIPYTPITLIDKMFDSIPLIKEEKFDVEVGVMYCVEMTLNLLRCGFTNITMVVGTHDEKIKIQCEKIDIKYKVINIAEEKNMPKFDVVVGNPPYTNGQILLYTKFFEAALNMSDIVAFIMPVQLESRHDKLKFHNERVKKHLIKMGENVSEYFDVGYDNIYYVIAGKSIQNEIIEQIDPIDSIPILYPERNRLNPVKGDTDIAIGNNVADGVQTIFKIHKHDKILYKKVEQYKVDKTSKKSDAPYLVFVNHTPSKGRFNCAILPNNNNIYWSMWTFAFECNSEEDAIKLKKWLQSEIIINEISTMLSVRNNQHTISKTLIARLPHYE